MNNTFDVQDLYIGTVVSIDKNTHEIEVYVPKLMPTLNTGFSETTYSIDLESEVVKTNTVLCQPRDFREELPKKGSLISIFFIDGDIKKIYWSVFDPFGTNEYVSFEKTGNDKTLDDFANLFDISNVYLKPKKNNMSLGTKDKPFKEIHGNISSEYIVGLDDKLSKIAGSISYEGMLTEVDTNKLYVPLARTIADISLEDNISAEVLTSKLDLATFEKQGAMSPTDKLNLQTLVALLGTDDADEVANTVGEILNAFSSFPEDIDIYQLINNKQDGNEDLDAILSLGNGPGILRKTGEHTWELDTTDYSTSLGTVTSVGGTGSVNGITLTGTVVDSGNLVLGGTLSIGPDDFSSQIKKTFLAAPNSENGKPVFRTILASDIPLLNQNTTGQAGSVQNSLSIKADNGSTEGTDLFVFDGSTSKVIEFKGGTNVSINKESGVWTFNSVDNNTDTHWSSKNIVGSSQTSKSNGISTNGNTYLNHIENNAVTSNHKISGSGIVTVSSDSNGNIIINSPDTNVDTNTATHKDGILKGSNIDTQVSYDPYSTQQDKISFDTSNTDPSWIERLNVNAHLYATKLFSNGIEVYNKDDFDITDYGLDDNVVHLDGTEDITGIKRFSSTIAFNNINGFTVSSSNKITNLNADLLDDHNGSYYLNYENFSNKPEIIINDGKLTWTDSTLGTTGQTVLGNLSGAYSANTDIDRSMSLTVGPALSSLASIMTGSSTGILKKTGQDVYGLDTTSYYHPGNLPAYPTVNDALLTLVTSGLGISGSDTFSANQANATTFTVSSNATTEATPSTIVYRDSGGDIKVDSKYYYNDKAYTEYNETDKCIDFVFIS